MKTNIRLLQFAIGLFSVVLISACGGGGGTGSSNNNGIGGNTCSGGQVGCLTLSGSDLGQDGTTFNSPTVQPFLKDPTTQAPTFIFWVEGVEGVGSRSVGVTLDAITGKPESAVFLRLFVGDDNGDLQKAHECNAPNCGGISHDAIAKSITFTNVVLQPDTTEGSAKTPLTLNGTLNYTP